MAAAEQQKEAQNKRRIGLGYTGLGDALVCWALRYDTDAARTLAADITSFMRDEAYLASVICPLSAAPSRCWMQTSTSPHRASPRGCRKPPEQDTPTRHP